MIALDEDPTVGELTSTNPPMLPTVALDRQVSLVFQLHSPQTTLAVEVEVTSLSSDHSREAPLQLFTGLTSASYRAAEGSWDRANEDVAVSYSTSIDGAQNYIKLYRALNPTLVVNKVTFRIP